jgi:peptidoglycan-associated lipoprotein
MMTRKILAAVALALTLDACAKHPTPMTPVPVTPPVVQSDTAALARMRDDSLRALREREQRDRERAAALNATQLATILGTVYFDYDKSELTDSAKAQLDAKIPLLAARPTLRIRITGHTDDRGSSEYNLALGLRRAAEVKAYLVAGGADAGRIDIFSMGEEQPAVQGTSDYARAKNRRAEFVQAGGGT